MDNNDNKPAACPECFNSRVVICEVCGGSGSGRAEKDGQRCGACNGTGKSSCTSCRTLNN